MSTWIGTTPNCTIDHAKLETVTTLVRASRSDISDADVCALVLGHRLAGGRVPVVAGHS